MCNCDHEDHFSGHNPELNAKYHEFLDAEASPHSIQFVGRVCYQCFTHHNIEI